MEQILIDQWTGRTAQLLQSALRLTNDRFAGHLGIAPRTVAGWRQDPEIVPRNEMQRILDTTLERSSATVRHRFASNFAMLGMMPAAAAPAVDNSASLTAEIEVMQARLGLMQKELEFLRCKAEAARS